MQELPAQDGTGAVQPRIRTWSMCLRQAHLMVLSLRIIVSSCTSPNMDDCHAVTTGPRIIAATPHAEVVVNEPVPPTPSSEAYIPSKVMHLMCSGSQCLPTVNACATQPCPAGIAFVLSWPGNSHSQNYMCVLCFCLLQLCCKNPFDLRRHVAELPLYT